MSTCRGSAVSWKRRNVVGSGVMVLVLAAGGCRQDKVVGPRSGSLLASLAVSPDSTPADGATTLKVTARLASDAPANQRIVSFSTTAGAFLVPTSSGVTASGQFVAVADDSGIATALLRAPSEPGLAILRATSGGSVKIDSVRFFTAYPEFVLVDADSFVVHSDTVNPPTVRVTARLRRTIGRVSSGISVRFTIAAPGGADPGQIVPDVVIDTSGNAEARYSPRGTAYRGPVTITASVVTAAGTVSGATTVTVLKP